MPRYFFHVFDGIDDVDTEGTVLEHDAEARRQAIVYASELLGVEAGIVRSGGAWRMDVNGDDGAPLFSINFNVTDTAGGKAT